MSRAGTVTWSSDNFLRRSIVSTGEALRQIINMGGLALLIAVIAFYMAIFYYMTHRGGK